MRAKSCSKCGILKPFTEFHRDRSRKSGLYPVCKECRKKEWQEGKSKTKKRQMKKLNWFYKMKKQLKCENCPEDRWYCLDFHHKNSDEKEAAVAIMLHKNYNKKKILEEIKKCQVLCANCHRELHWKENNNEMSS